MGDDVGVCVLAKVEAHRQTLRPGSRRVVLGGARDARGDGEARRDGRGGLGGVWRVRQGRRFRVGGEGAGEHDSTGMDRPETGMNAPGDFVQRGDGFRDEVGRHNVDFVWVKTVETQ